MHYSCWNQYDLEQEHNLVSSHIDCCTKAVDSTRYVVRSYAYGPRNDVWGASIETEYNLFDFFRSIVLSKVYFHDEC